MAASVKRVFALPDKLKENKDSYRYSPYSKNLVAVHEDCLFVWHAVEEHILVLTLKEKGASEDEEPQILTLSSPPSFSVEELKFSGCGHHLVLSGKNGVLVVELPRRWGGTQFHGAGFEGGKDIVLCKSWKIAQRFLSCNKHVQVCYVAWYPGCPSGSHLLLLCSDSHLRLYNMNEPQTAVASIPICNSDPEQSGTFNSFSRVSFPNTAAALGDTAVSFDFGPAYAPDEDGVKNEADLIWPIFILKGNGDICLINSNLKNMRGRGPRVQGPLTMHPPAEDNYGADACSVACLQTSPPVLVVATCAGILYHCLALRNAESSQLEESNKHAWNPLEENADVDLYVYESVELSISLTQAEPEDELFSCPIRLSLDPSLKFRYHCTHSAGVHAVLMPSVPQIEKFFSLHEENANQDTLQEILDSSGQESLVEHLVCTQPFPSQPANPILGLAISNTVSGSFLICLMSSWDALMLPLGSSFTSLQYNQFSLDGSSDASADEEKTNAGEKVSDNFLSSVLTSFQGSSQTPMLKTDPSGVEPSTQKCIELLGSVTQSLREDRIQRLQIAHTQMQKRVKMLRSQKVQMLTELATISSDQEALRSKAEELAEKYEDVSHRQQLITKKVECALSLLQRQMPVLSDAEVSMQEELHGVEESLKHLENLLQQAQLKLKFKTDIENVRSQMRDSRASDQLESSNQLSHIKELITQQGNSVSSLVRKVNFLMKEMCL